MRVGDKVQYNKKYSPDTVVTILEMDKTHALIQFPSGSKIATPISGLWPLRLELTDPYQQTLFNMELMEVV